MLKFIAYYMDECDGVGAIRSETLYRMINKYNINNSLITRNTFGVRAQEHMWIWIVCVFLLLLKEKRHVIYVSCGPFLHLPFIAFACLISRHKLIVDFRDGWSVNIGSNYGKCGRLSFKQYVKKMIVENIEKIIYKICEAFIVCTPGLKKVYMELFSDSRKIHMVINGHMIKKCYHQDVINKKELKIVCSGKFLYYDNKAIKKLNSFKERLRRDYGDNIKYTIYFIGTDENTKEKLRRMDHIILKPRMKYEELIRFLSDADMGLALVRNEELELGTKMFDYIGLGIPVYDWFKQDSMFHTFFKSYLFKKIVGAKEIMPNDGDKFYREKNLIHIVKIIKEKL